MANLTLMRARIPTAVSGSANGIANLMTPDPKEATSETASDFDVDFGESVTFDTVFVGHLSKGADLGVALRTATSYGLGLVLLAAPTVGPATARRRHAFLYLATPVTTRYFRLSLSGTGTLSAGILAIGDSTQPAYGHEWGSGRLIRDMSEVTGLRGGGFGIERGSRAGGYQFTCGDLTDAEVDALYDMVEEVGESAPVVICRDPALTGADLNNALHYGLLDRPEAYTREALGRNSWSFRVKDWV